MIGKALTNQWQLLLLAMSFFTRLPVPVQNNNDDLCLSKVNRYFAFVGILVGLFCGAIFYGASLFLPISVALILAMCSSVLLTGGLHEDGLADICDGFGGGTDKEKKLAIMKDSAIGTYGTLALVLGLLLKYQLLLALTQQSVAKGQANVVILYFILSHALSRVVAGSISLSLPYARTGDGKMGHIMQNTQGKDFLILALFGLVPLLFIDVSVAVVLVISMLITRQVLLSLFRWQIGGYTGDCLGASQQISELVCLAVLVAYWSQNTQLNLMLGQIS